MSDYQEYIDAAKKHGHKKPGPGADQTNGSSSGCMVAAGPVVGILAGVTLLTKVVWHVRSSAVQDVR